MFYEKFLKIIQLFNLLYKDIFRKTINLKKKLKNTIKFKFPCIGPNRQESDR